MSKKKMNKKSPKIGQTHYNDNVTDGVPFDVWWDHLSKDDKNRYKNEMNRGIR